MRYTPLSRNKTIYLVQRGEYRSWPPCYNIQKPIVLKVLIDTNLTFPGNTSGGSMLHIILRWKIIHD